MKDWKFEDLLNAEFSCDELIHTLEVIDKFKNKYKNDDIIQGMEEIIRDEICKLFGGGLDFDN